MITAVTRPVSDSLQRCVLTYLDRSSIDVDLARAQHRAYEALLESVGVTVVRLARFDESPDAVFVEDAAVVLDEVAIVARSGIDQREGETADIAQCLAHYRKLCFMTAPATLDGGDVLQLGRTLFVGRSTRTNEPGLEQLRAAVAPHGYKIVEVAVRRALHLKTACTHLGQNVLLANPDWLDVTALGAFDILAVDSSEPWAANVLRLGEHHIMPAGFPATQALLEKKGFNPMTLSLTEFQKAEGGPTCLSLILSQAA